MLNDSRPSISAWTVGGMVLTYFLFSELFVELFPDSVFGTLFVDLILGFVGALLLVYVHREPEFSKPVCKPEHLCSLFFAGFVFWISISVIVSYYQRLAGQWPVDILGGLRGWNKEGYAIIALIGAPLFEEIFFRGFIFSWLESKISFIFATFVTALLFASVHGTDSQMYGAFLLGTFLCVLYYCTGNIWLNVGFHSVYNIGMLFIQPIMPVPEGMAVHLNFVKALNVVLLLYTVALLGAVVYIKRAASRKE